jgi:hypothetical protein
MALGFIQPLIETSTMNIPGVGRVKQRPVRKANNLAAICEWIV